MLKGYVVRRQFVNVETVDDNVFSRRLHEEALPRRRAFRSKMMADEVLPTSDLQPASTEAPKPAENATTTPSAANEPVATNSAAGGGGVAESTGAGGELLQREMFSGFGGWAKGVLKTTPSWLVSMVAHMVILLGLALLTLPEAVPEELRQLLIAPDDLAEFDDLEELEDVPLEEIPLDVTAVETDIVPEEVAIDPADDMEPAAVEVELSDFGIEHAPRADILDTVGGYGGKGVDGRGGQTKAALKKKYGATEESEQAVAAALKWLAEHQMPDGGWSFNHAVHPNCRGRCRNPGQLAKARNGATGLALLPFLGAGQTHNSGSYKGTVADGLSFLVRALMRKRDGSLWEDGGQMYSHGLASIALCEAYAMTHDKSLYAPCKAAVNFISYAQDPVRGGWRYKPRVDSDTSVVGWQIMALKSADMAYLEVNPATVHMASRYLDSVQANSGANYGYTSPGNGAATTAIGLLCRMYLGWEKSNPALERGVQFLSNKGPDPTNMYYNYYATQVLRHWEGEEWTKWNNVMRDQLVNSQALEGHEAGSWYMNGHHSSKGGRLYCTAMAAMVLEVYYRHMPLYQTTSIDNEFPE